MSHILVFDCASSRFHTSKSTGEEPRVVRLAWWKEGERDPQCRLIKPSLRMTIDSSTFPYHKLSMERLLAKGVEPRDAIKDLEAAATGASAIVAFHGQYHWKALYQLMGVEATQPANAVCAMRLATPILAIPAMRPGNPLKSPNLREACDFFGVPAPSSDDPIELAMQTVRAVRGVYEGCLSTQTK
jgi:hypothetical protein